MVVGHRRSYKGIAYIAYKHLKDGKALSEAGVKVNEIPHRGDLIVQVESNDSAAAHNAEESRVLIFAFTFSPFAAAGTFRTLRFVRYLSDFGWKPLVLSARSEFYPDIPTDPNLNACIPAATIVERTAVLRPIERLTAIARRLMGKHRAVAGATSAGSSQVSQVSPSYSPGRKLRNAWSGVAGFFSIPDRQVGWMIPAFIAAMRMIREHRPAVLYSSGPPHSSHLTALLAKKFSKVPVVLDFRDPWAHCEWTHGSSTFKDRIAKRFEKLCVQRADMIILNTEALCRQFRNNYAPSLHDKFVTITNGYDPELKSRIESLIDNTTAIRDQQPPNEFRMCHAGSVYGERSLEPLVAAISILNRRGHHVVLEQIGRIADIDKLKQTIAELQAEDYITLTSHRPHDEVMRRMADVDAHVLLQPGTSIQIPGKLFEMMMFGKPIFAISGPGETTDMIRRYNLGVAVESADPTFIAAELERLVTAGPGDSCGSALALAEFDGHFLTGKLAGVFDSVLKIARSEVTV